MSGSNKSNAAENIVLSHDLDEVRIKEIAAFFKSHRLSAGVELEAAAKALNLEDHTQLLAYESGGKAIPADEMFALANLFNIPPEDLLLLIYNLYK